MIRPTIEKKAYKLDERIALNLYNCEPSIPRSNIFFLQLLNDIKMHKGCMQDKTFSTVLYNNASIF